MSTSSRLKLLSGLRAKMLAMSIVPIVLLGGVLLFTLVAFQGVRPTCGA